MRISSVAFLALTASVVSSFAPVAFPSSARSQQTSKLFSEKPESEEGLDLDLEEMFQMFDAADKEEDFDKAVEKVKGKEE